MTSQYREQALKDARRLRRKAKTLRSIGLAVPDAFAGTFERIAASLEKGALDLPPQPVQGVLPL